MFKREINRRWGLIAAMAWARLLIGRIHILVLGFGDVTELGAVRPAGLKPRRSFRKTIITKKKSFFGCAVAL
jgi:hypothetical protein